jgi:nucleoside-diphosphate-sugar epimerase
MIDALIVGADSKVGRALRQRLSAEWPWVAGTSRRIERSKGRLLALDLECPSPLPAARVTYLLAAVNGFKRCNDDPATATLVNFHGTMEVALRQFERGGRVVFMSSCAAEHHLTTVYGSLKLQVEEALLFRSGMAAILRTGPIMFPGRAAYPDRDFYPLPLEDVVETLADLMRVWAPGVHRITRPLLVAAK